MPAAKEAKVLGLRFTLPGAPEEPHMVCSPDTGQSIPGHYHPVIPTPVGGPGETSEATARRWSDDPRYHLTLVEMTAADAARWRGWWQSIRPELRNGVAKAARTAEPPEMSRVTDETHALEEAA